MWILTVAETLQDHRVTFAIAGGYAVALHGAVRGTVDIDLCVSVDLENLSRIERALQSLNLISRIPITAKDLAQFREEYIQKKNLIAWSFVDPKNPIRVVDILIHYNLMKEDVVSIKLHGHKIPLLNKSRLIALKLQAGRPQDLEDVKALRELDEKN